MKFVSTIAALAVFFTSALDALTITLPASGSTFFVGQPIQLLLTNGVNEAFTNALVTFASPFGSFVQNVAVGAEQTIYLPCEVNGSTTVAARNGITQALSVQIQINPAPYTGYGNPYANPCVDPCVNPCPNPCPRRSSRRGCRFYSENGDNTATEFKAEEQVSAESN